jgi:hypothetical protein
VNDSNETGFYVAPFSIDGTLEGIGFWKRSDLSGFWIEVCSDLMKGKGGNVDTFLERQLSHLRVKLTSAKGAALLTLFAREKPLSSCLLLSGTSTDADQQAAGMFVESVRKTNIVREVAAVMEPFASIFGINERPLMVVIPWPDETVSDQDHELVRELGLHFARAFFEANVGRSIAP